MDKKEFMEYVDGADKEKKVQYMLNNGAYEVLNLDEFMEIFGGDPSVIADYVKGSGLNLDKEYIRLAEYYYQATEADTTDELFSDEEVHDYFDDLADTLDDSLGEFDGVLIEMEA